MRRAHLVPCVLAAVAACLAAAATAPAQTLDDRLRAELTSVLAQLRELQNSQSTLVAQKTAAEHERDALKARLARLGGAARPASPALQADLTAERARTAQLTEQLQQAQADAARYRDAFTQADQLAQQTRSERDRLSAQTDAGLRALADCETKNIQLLGIGRELLSAYGRVGVGEALARGEPLLGLERARLERIAQDYGDQLYSAKFDRRAVRPPPAGPTPTPAH